MDLSPPKGKVSGSNPEGGATDSMTATRQLVAAVAVLVGKATPYTTGSPAAFHSGKPSSKRRTG